MLFILEELKQCTGVKKWEFLFYKQLWVSFDTKNSFSEVSF